MTNEPEPMVPALSPAKARGLFIAALILALLGLTMLDVVPAQTPRHAVDQRSIDCIVASAVFAGVKAPS
jgi:hypothetical protein